MAVTKCKELLEGRSGSTDENGHVTQVRVFSVETDDKADGPATVEYGLRYPDPADPNVPLGSVPIRQFDSHPFYKRALLRTCDVSATASPTAWTVRLTYRSGSFAAPQAGPGTAVLSATTPTQTPNNSSSSGGNTASRPAPLRIPTYTFSTRAVQAAGERYKDYSDGLTKPYVNTVGDQFEGLVVEYQNLVVNVEYWSTEMTVSKIGERIGKVNITPWLGFASKCCRVNSVGRSDVYDLLSVDGSGQDIYGLCWKVNIEVECQGVEWFTKVLNTGRRGRLVAGGPVLPFVDRNGQPIETPVALTSGGVAIRDPAAANPTAIAASEFHYCEFLDKLGFDFDTLII